ncbi:MAG: hypothetical protein ACRETU_04255 [Steroidobacterales bacterium]
MHLKDVYEQLVQLAWGGDAAAARSLSQELRFCDSVRALSRPPGNTELEPGIELSAAQAQRLQHPQEYCREITEEDTTNAVHWAKVAADAGDYVGMQDWAVMQGMTDAGYETWDSLWKRGYVFAITPLAIAYSKGVPSSAGGKADSVTSFAFRYAYYKLQEARLEGRNTQGTRRVLSTLQAEIQYSGGSLSPGEYQQAIELAKRLLADNRNCCIPPSW